MISETLAWLRRLLVALALVGVATGCDDVERERKREEQREEAKWQERWSKQCAILCMMRGGTSGVSNIYPPVFCGCGNGTVFELTYDGARQVAGQSGGSTP